MILFVVEGAKTEIQFIRSISKCFFDGVLEHYVLVKEGTIHSIAKEISEDEYLDFDKLLLEYLDEERREEFKRIKFSEIFLIFDYDGHAHDAINENLKFCLKYLNDETGHGKLYISYPMIEANKHIVDFENFNNLVYPVANCSNYKNHVESTTINKLKHVGKYDVDIWKIIIWMHLNKARCICNHSSDSANLEQETIFEFQLNNFINKNSEISILGSFPLFLFDYFGDKILLENLNKQKFQDILC